MGGFHPRHYEKDMIRQQLSSVIVPRVGEWVEGGDGGLTRSLRSNIAFMGEDRFVCDTDDLIATYTKARMISGMYDK